MKAVIILLLTFFAFAVFAADRGVCVRNYTTKQGASACRMGFSNYTFVRHATDPDKEVCARVYADGYCEVAEEYQRIRDLDGKVICVLDNAQEPVVNLCESVPDQFDYASREG